MTHVHVYSIDNHTFLHNICDFITTTNILIVLCMHMIANHVITLKSTCSVSNHKKNNPLVNHTPY